MYSPAAGGAHEARSAGAAGDAGGAQAALGARQVRQVREGRDGGIQPGPRGYYYLTTAAASSLDVNLPTTVSSRRVALQVVYLKGKL